MNEEERIVALEEENRKLKADNDKLVEIMAQLHVTLNRLIFRYVSEERESKA